MNDALAIVDETASDSGPDTKPESETVGAGPTRIAMLVPRSGEEKRDDAADYRDGAVLAMHELGDGQATLTVYDTKGVPTEVTRLARKAAVAGADIIIGPVTQSDVAAVINLQMDQQPLMIALTPDIPLGKGDIFTMISDEIDSASSVITYALAAGKSKFVAFVPDDLATSSRARLKKTLSAQHANVIGIIDYPADEAAAAREIARRAGLLDEADAVLVLAGSGLAAVVHALRAENVITVDRVLLGTSAWSPGVLSSNDADGVLVALPNGIGLRQIAASFTAAYGRPPSADAAYAYDATATALGIARVLGPDALNAETLTSDTGFRGATGVFRFNRDGSIDRLLPIYVNKDGKLKLVRAAPKSF